MVLSNRLQAASLAVILAAALAAAALADSVTLKGGQVFEGTVTRTEDGGYRVKTPYAVVTFREDEVAEVTYGPTPREVYEKRAAEIPADDAHAWYELGVYADDRGLKDLAEAAFRRAVDADPDHEKARAELGYIREGDEWLTPEEAARRNGLVPYRGRFVTPEERERLESEEGLTARRRRLAADIRTQAFLIVNGSAEESRTAREKLAGMSDPEALGALIEMLAEPEPGVRIAVLEALENYREDRAAYAALEAAIWDPSERVRREAARVLARKESEAAFRAAINSLTFENRLVRFRVSELLGTLGDERAIPYLARYLYWYAPQQPPPEPERRRGDDGIERRGRLRYIAGIGSKVAPGTVAHYPIIRSWPDGERINFDEPREFPEPSPYTGPQRVLNYAALNSLRILTERDFRFDKQAWLSWYYANARGRSDLPRPVR